MARERAYVQITGRRRVGKTLLIERLLQSDQSKTLMVALAEARRGIEEPIEIADAGDRKLRRYLDAGASDVVRYVYSPDRHDGDEFWSTDFIQNYSEGIIFEGAMPVARQNSSVNEINGLRGWLIATILPIINNPAASRRGIYKGLFLSECITPQATGN